MKVNFDSKSLSSIKLTETTQKGGCAAKLPAGELREFLSELKMPKPPELLVGSETMDDAALWDLGDDRLLIQTLDFFTPIIDDARDFGAIAATNSLSDIYAMGGKPATALTILAFPSSKLPLELIKPLMEGALEKITESGACLAGGHSIDDETLKLGFSVSGFVKKSKAWLNSGAKVGDVLILTKGLGTGTITSAAKNKVAKEEWLNAATSSMKKLNNAVELLTDIKVNAATDITGFGLAGHAMQMCQAGQVSFKIETSKLPSIVGARECLEKEVLNRAHRTNLKYVENQVEFADEVSPADRWLTVDPQTSGGLLLLIPKDQSSSALQKLLRNFPDSAIIGEVHPWSSKSIYFS